MNPILENVLVGVLVPIVPVVGTLITLLLYRLINLISKKLKIENDNYYLQAIYSMVTESVSYVNQVMVDTLKVKDRFTIEKQKEAFEIAKERVMTLLTTDGKEVITRLYGDYETYLDGLIESLVRDMKVVKTV